MTTLDMFTKLPRWVAWRNEERSGKITKVPYSPRGDRKAEANDPSTWGTRAEAEAKAGVIVNGAGGGIGIELGDLGNGEILCGIDLDTCRKDDGTLEEWAINVMREFKSYTEISPSLTGAKVFFRLRIEDLPKLREALGMAKFGRQFKRGTGKDHPPAIEVYLGNRYFAVTEEHIDWTPSDLTLVSVEKLLWLLTDYGPRFAGAAAEEKESDSPRPRGRPKDDSRSGKAYRLGASLRKRGSTFDEMCKALRADPEIEGWYQEKGDARQLQRIWDKAPAGRGLPIIEITGGGLSDIVDRVDILIIEHDAEIFQRGGMLVRPVFQPINIRNGEKRMAWRIVKIGIMHLIDRLTRIIDFQQFSKSKKEYVSVNCPENIAKAYLERCGNWRVPIISGITDAPTLRPDGSVIETPGYDAITGLLYKPSCEYARLLTNPKKENAQAALKVLCDLISEFPFVDSDGNQCKNNKSPSRSVALSFMLTACSRHAIARAPLHGFDAPVPGSGKSLLVDCASMIATGHESASMGTGQTEEEFEKRLGAALLAGDPIINLDNVEGPLGGELLCRCLTQDSVQIRILGRSEQPTIPCTALFSANGNNLIMKGDVTRRTIVARLDPKVERPEELDFKSDPLDTIRTGRAIYVRACLTILRAFVVAGKPNQDTKPLGSYEEWSSLIRDSLMWLDEPDPVKTMEKVRNTDPVLLALAEMLTQWDSAAKAESIAEATVKRIIEVAKSNFSTPQNDGSPKVESKYPDLFDALQAVAGDQRGGINGVTLGKWLGKNKGRVVNGLRFEHGSGKAMGGVLRWRILQS